MTASADASPPSASLPLPANQPAHRVRLKPKRDASVQRRHPWIFSRAIADVAALGRRRSAPPPAAGTTVRIETHDGRPLGVGAYAPTSQIAVRVWTFAADADAERPIDADFVAARLARAIASRRRDGLLDDDVPRGVRLVHAASDGLPGVVVDRYGPVAVVQASAAGAEAIKPWLVDALRAQLPAIETIYERSDLDVRRKEGLAPTTGLLWGHPPDAATAFVEDDLRFTVDVRGGHKTGFYLDQRPARALLRRHVHRAVIDGRPPTVLNAFAYTGAFTIAALDAGAAHVTQIDSSRPALAAAAQMRQHAGFADAPVDDLAGDAFQVLRQLDRDGQRFDVVVLDPPKFVAARAHLTRACRGYQDLNRLALRLLRPGGTLFTFSCSGLLAPELFQKVVADAALEAGDDGGPIDAAIVARLGAGADHPVALAFPEGRYLKGLSCRRHH